MGFQRGRSEGKRSKLLLGFLGIWTNVEGLATQGLIGTAPVYSSVYRSWTIQYSPLT